MELVVVRTTIERVVAILPGENIGTRSTVQYVVASTTLQRVIATIARQGIVTGIADQSIVACGPNQGLQLYARDIPYRRQVISESNFLDHPAGRGVVPEVVCYPQLIRGACDLEQ